MFRRYLRQRGLVPSDDLLLDAQLLLGVLQDGPRSAFGHALKAKLIKRERLEKLFPRMKERRVEMKMDILKSNILADIGI